MTKTDRLIKHLLFLGLILLFGSIFFRTCNSDYMTHKDRKCVLLDKMVVDGGKYSDNFYFILKEERGIVFDLIVAPATYSQTKVGDTVIFNLRQFDIKQTSQENTIDFFGGFGSLAMLIVVFVSYVLFLLGAFNTNERSY